MIDLDTCLLQIHRASREIPAGDFREHALMLLRTQIPFDSACWGTARVDHEGALPVDVFLYNQPAEFLTSYQQVRTGDYFARRIARTPGVPRLFSWVGKDHVDAKTDEFEAHCEQFGHRNALATAHFSSSQAMYSFVSLMRFDACDGFSDDEQRTKERLMPHLMEAWLSNFYWEGRKRGTAGGANEAMSDTADGLSIGQLSPYLVSLFQTEWPTWSPPELPAPLGRCVELGNVYLGRDIVVKGRMVAGMLFLQGSDKSPREALTPRELSIAQDAMQGLTYKQIARHLNVSPSTVRTHLHRVYQKLRISNKTALCQRLALH